MYFERNEVTNFCSSKVNINEIPCIFRDGFFNGFNKLKAKERSAVSEALPYLYKLWYYSTLMDGTYFSPSNFINSQVREKFGEEARVIPLVKPIYKYRVLKDLKFSFKLFSIENHPVLVDLKLFLDSCSPDIGLNEQGLLLEEEVNKIINFLTFAESFYVTFLTNIAFEMKFLEDMPSINTYRAIPVKSNIEGFFSLPKLEQLKKLSQTVISMASKVINQVFTLDRKAFSEHSLTKLFSNAQDLDDYITKLFKKLNLNLEAMDLEQLLISAFNEKEPVELPENTLAAMTLMMELSFLIDAYLLTPLGHYLQLIQPIYNEEMNFAFHFDQLIDAQKSELPLIKFYFSMSNGFDLTALGSKVLLNGKKPEREFQKLKGKTNYRKLFEDIRNYYYVNPSPIYDLGNISYSASEHRRIMQEIEDFVNPKKRKNK